LTGLVDKVLIYNMGHSAPAPADSQGFNCVYDMTNIHKVIHRGLYLRGQTEDRFPFTGHVPFSGLNL
jgi:hypothetical protein